MLHQQAFDSHRTVAEDESHSVSVRPPIETVVSGRVVTVTSNLIPPMADHLLVIFKQFSYWKFAVSQEEFPRKKLSVIFGQRVFLLFFVFYFCFKISSSNSIGKMSTTDKTQGELELGYQHTLVSCLIFNDFVQVCLPLLSTSLSRLWTGPKRSLRSRSNEWTRTEIRLKIERKFCQEIKLIKSKLTGGCCAWKYCGRWTHLTCKWRTFLQLFDWIFLKWKIFCGP